MPLHTNAISKEFRHSRMHLAGIHGNFGLDPRLKRSGVTCWELLFLDPSPNFQGTHEEHEVRNSKISISESFVYFVRFVVKMILAC